jgi:hypothetical protein
MTDEFDISRLHGRWQVVATSERGKAFAAGNPRFQSGKAVLDPAAALVIYQELHDKGYLPRVLNGLPPVGRKLLYSRLALLLAVIGIALIIFVLLI